MKRAASGVLLRDPAGRVLLVDPTYKDGWEIPGGMIEVGESPREAAHRECLEELGREIEVGDLLCVHYTHNDGIMFVFDAGRTTLDADQFVLPPDELRGAAFTPIAQLAERLHAGMVARLTAAITAAASGSIAYLER